MLKIANLSENLLISVGVDEKNEVVGGGGSSKINKNLSKFQKPKISIILSNISFNIKTI